MRQKYKGEDIRARLHGTILRYKGVPYLADVDAAGMVGMIDVATGNLITRVYGDDEGIDISSINIGFVNIIDPDYKCAVYLKREPLRRFKQPIELDFLTQKVLRQGMTSIPKNKLMSAGFVDAVLGKFPPLEEAINLITKRGWHSVGLSRDIAVKREADNLKVYLKDTEVGFMKIGDKDRKLLVPTSDVSYYHCTYLNDIKGWTVIEGIK